MPELPSMVAASSWSAAYTVNNARGPCAVGGVVWLMSPEMVPSGCFTMFPGRLGRAHARCGSRRYLVSLPGELPAPRQVVHATGGFAYGVVGADLHVFTGRGPVYLLTEYRSDRAEQNVGQLLAQPGRLLDARHQIVDFTGRHEELAELAAWRDRRGDRLAVRWLYAPGGQGKTRLAMRFSADCAAAGWKTVMARHGFGAILPPPGSQDMRLGDATGLLLVVDYADRWPVSHLTWLFSNALLHREVPTRVLLLARSSVPWPTIRAELAKLSAVADSRALGPIPVARESYELWQGLASANPAAYQSYLASAASVLRYLRSAEDRPLLGAEILNILGGDAGRHGG